jgi:hypothetical protein
MEASKNKRKAGPKRPEVRTLKIQPKYREHQFETVKVPEIRFSGNWLEKLGFNYGRRVTITTMNELLIVRLQPEQSRNQPAKAGRGFSRIY